MLDALLQTDLDETQRGFAETVRTSGEVLLTILNDVLDFSKVEAGKLELDSLAFDPRRLVSDVADLMRGSARAKKLDLVIGIDPSVPEAIWGDPVRLRQVLTNLIGNAFKFTAVGGITVRARTAAPSEGSPSESGNLTLRFEIEDTGIGIEAAKREKIFAPFVQADSSTSRKYGGTGLGLAISGQLVELMGGDYGVTSELGVGSNFWFTVETSPASLSDLDPDKAGEDTPTQDTPAQLAPAQLAPAPVPAPVGVVAPVRALPRAPDPPRRCRRSRPCFSRRTTRSTSWWRSRCWPTPVTRSRRSQTVPLRSRRPPRSTTTRSSWTATCRRWTDTRRRRRYAPGRPGSATPRSSR